MGMSAWVVKPLSLGMLRQALMSHCRKANGLPTPTLKPACTPQTDREGWIELSPAMRELMAQTLLADIAQIEQGLVDMDALAVRQRLHSLSDALPICQRLHSLSGALASVHAQTLHALGHELENALHEGPMTTAIVQRIRALCTRLAAVAQCLSEEPR